MAKINKTQSGSIDSAKLEQESMIFLSHSIFNVVSLFPIKQLVEIFGSLQGIFILFKTNKC